MFVEEVMPIDNLSSPLRPLGHLDLEAFLAERSVSHPGRAEVYVQLIDAGMIRPFSQVYEWRLGDDGVSLLVRPISSNRQAGQTTFTLPRTIDLTPQMIAFFGAYDGDGNKTGEIGFAQNEVHLQEFVFACLRVLFGTSFDIDVNILEDTRYFDSEVVKRRIREIGDQWTYQGRSQAEISERKLQEQVLLERYQSQFSAAIPQPRRRIRYTISPLKGARTAGASSFEIIHNFVGSRRALPLLLDIIKSTIKTIHVDQVHSEIHREPSRPSIVWVGLPRSFSQEFIDTRAFVSSDRCRYATSRGSVSYQILSSDDDHLWIKKPGGSRFAVYTRLGITPLLCLMFGLYLAEGTTAKAKFFTFRRQPEDLALGFNSSEEISLDIFLGGLSSMFPSPESVIEQWLVKIGTKYFPESTALGEKLGVPVVRGGLKGQGIARGLEITQAVKRWALVQSPIMQRWEDKFSHIEFTGSGIPRIDVRCKAYPAPFVFSLVHDLVFEPDTLMNFLIRQDV